MAMAAIGPVPKILRGVPAEDRDVSQSGRLLVCGAALQHEAAVAVTAINIALFVDFHPHAGMAQRGGLVGAVGADVGSPVAGDARGIGVDGFGRVAHELRH
ncbi:hypothetical protein PP1Y_AT2276 [Novosphingobium sp. PP1Y]|nr:hypothetical protein PP1Y_AT2276 [Novosphingobium sp. PP1Y]